MAKNRIHNEIDSLETSVSGQSSAITTLQSQTAASDAHIALVGNEGQVKNPHGVTAADVGAATPADVSNAIAGVVTALDWKEMVATFEDLATTYPNAVEGWTASVAADNITYRYDGTNWVGISANAIPLAANNTNGLMSSSDYTKLTGIENGAKDDQNAGEVPYNNADSTLLATNVKTAIDELDLKKLDATALSSSLAIYPTITNSEIITAAPQAVVGVTSITDVRYPDATNVSTGAITGTVEAPQIVGRIVTDPGVIVGSPGIITISTLGNIRKTAGNSNQNARFFYRVFRYDGVAEVLITEPIAESDVTPIITSTVYEEFYAFALLNNGVFAPQDRLVIQFYAIVVENSGAVYEFQFGGDTPVRTLLPVPVSVIPAPSAADILVDTANFAGVLDSNDSTVQLALDSLDDHNHDGRYFTKEQLRPVTGDPEEDDLNTVAILDGRYPTFEITDEIIGGTNPQFVNLNTLQERVRVDQWNANRFNGITFIENDQATQISDYGDAVIGFDQRLDVLEAAGPGGGILENFTGSLASGSWTADNGFFRQTISIGGNGVGSDVETYDFNFQTRGINNNDFPNLPPQDLTWSSTTTSGPITITKNGGGAFGGNIVGSYIIVNVTNVGNVFYLVSARTNDNQVTAYYQPGPSGGGSRTLDGTVYGYNQGTNNIQFLFASLNGTGPNPEDPIVAQINFYEEQTQQNYGIANEFKGFTMETNFAIPQGATSITGLAEYIPNLSNGERAYAIVLDNTGAWVSKAEGLRQIVRNNNGTIEYNTSSTYGTENWQQGGGDVKFMTGFAMASVEQNRVSPAQWAGATQFPDITNASNISIGIALAASNINGSARTAGVNVTFGVPVAREDILTTDNPFVDLNITTADFGSIAAIESDWSLVKYADVTATNQLTFYATEQPNVNLPIQVGVVK